MGVQGCEVVPIGVKSWVHEILSRCEIVLIGVKSWVHLSLNGVKKILDMCEIVMAIFTFNFGV